MCIIFVLMSLQSGMDHCTYHGDYITKGLKVYILASRMMDGWIKKIVVRHIIITPDKCFFFIHSGTGYRAVQVKSKKGKEMKMLKMWNYWCDHSYSELRCHNFLLQLQLGIIKINVIWFISLLFDVLIVRQTFSGMPHWSSVVFSKMPCPWFLSIFTLTRHCWINYAEMKLYLLYVWQSCLKAIPLCREIMQLFGGQGNCLCKTEILET